MTTINAVSCLVDSAAGTDVPKRFANNFSFECEVGEVDYPTWKGISVEELEILREGSDQDWYWETWDDVLGNATFTSNEGNVYHLWQDGDLFAYCEELMTDEEYRNLFGVNRD